MTRQIAFILAFFLAVSSPQAFARVHSSAEESQSSLEERARKRAEAVKYSQSPETAGKAEEIFKEIAKEHEDTDSLMDLASSYYKTDFDETYRLCNKAFLLNNGKEYSRATTKLGMAGSRYRKHEFEQARILYQEGLSLLSKDTTVAVVRLLLDGLGATYLSMHDYAACAKTYEELYTLNRDLYGASDVECGWSLLQAAYAYSKMGQKPRAAEAMTRAIWTFRKNNEERIKSEFELLGKPLDENEKKQLIANMYGIRSGDPPPDPLAAAPASKYTGLVNLRAEGVSPWKRQFKQMEAPGYVWLDPKQEVKAIVFCIHGLGLHHKSYEPLAKSLAPLKIMTIAMDVRGFGTYMEAAGFEKLSMQDCVDDLKGIVKILRKDYPRTPLFILGESMGGALALRVVAELPGEVDGLICSVPSGARYKSAATALKIGANFLLDKTKPVPVGYSVIKQATQDPEIQRSWIDDPNSRLQLSPEELINFQLFMDENSKFATQIKDKPVILFQGHNDRLVKEQGTLDLFNALGTPQKTIILLGDTEHLIFEVGQFKAELPFLLDAWIKTHSKRAASL